ncbi:MAG TPA: HAD family hydrolase [Acidisarcina sp.]|nr:HAD family hydrolase [Acidisarcina sp.]
MSQAAPGAETPQHPKSPGQVFLREGFAWDRQNAYLFDIDGTLLRSRDRVHFNSFAHSVRHVTGYELNLQGVSVHGSTDTAILRDAFRASNIADSEWKPQLEPILALMRQTVVEQRDSLQPFLMPGVEATLRHLQSAGALLGLATGNLEVIGWLKVEAAGLKEWFRFGGFSDRFDIRAEMIAHAAELARRIAGPDASICVVGDTPWDISAAKANSLPTIAVATGHFTWEELMQHAPEACTSTLEDLLHATAPAANRNL